MAIGVHVYSPGESYYAYSHQGPANSVGSFHRGTQRVDFNFTALAYTLISGFSPRRHAKAV